MFENIIKRIKCKLTCCFHSRCSYNNEDNKENNQKEISQV